MFSKMGIHVEERRLCYICIKLHGYFLRNDSFGILTAKNVHFSPHFLGFWYSFFSYFVFCSIWTYQKVCYDDFERFGRNLT